ncbi:AMP-binding protein [Gloeocapsa sp. PCC 73106]|uniref:AMP-binding protein n=1 Tax=Gloeocapsa sp. PCC 73106 TaxID=102232 RepID=UPI0002ACC7D8|nr:AMP-binding protein [Gloeocapsa sp. PCC 73106]ELR99536.1 acyl-CoA synthetase (AMP-forming)/AMP-acid ligase II [Gloeocapsa sp. PCC 73106]
MNIWSKPQLTLVDLLQYRSLQQNNQIAYSFLVDDDTKEINQTYQELAREARKVAVQLQARNLAGKRAILLYRPGLEFINAFFGCLYAGVVGVPVYPPQFQQNLSRLQRIITDSQASIILTTKEFQDNPQFTDLPHLITDRLEDDTASDWLPPKLNSDTLAFIQYTSGSTGNPKGVMLSHGNLLHNLALIYKAFRHSSDTKVVSWLPPYHDMGLIGGILQPFYGGFPVILMSPLSVIRRPIRWLKAISRYQATTSGGPNFAYNLCLQKITPEEKQTLDLSTWEVAFIGAEPISSQTLTQFAETFAPCGFRPEAFYPCYGLAEATLFVSGGVKNQSLSPQQRVSCGQTYSEQTVRIVDSNTLAPLPDGQVGEILVSGASIAQGYWNQPEKTQETFHAKLEQKPFLRTGDLGFLQDGELFVTGRIKDLIIIRGQNYYPQDLEQTIEQSHLAIRQGCCAAFSIEIAGEEQLAIAAEIKRESSRQLNFETLFKAMRGAISQEYGLQVHTILLLKQGSIPKTTSGKIQRHACKNQLPVARWSLESSQKSDNLNQWLRSYAQDQINSRLIDERRCIPPSIVLDFGNKGLLGMQVPVQYGGLALNNTETMRILEQLGAIDTTLALFVGLNNILGIRPLLHYGSQKLKDELLPQLATGRELAAFALTETVAGSNPQAIVSQAIKSDQGGWLLHGQKIWSGSGSWAGIINVFVKERDGISGFVVQKGTPGLRQGLEALTMGMRGMVQNTVYFDNVLVQEEHRLGQPGMGMKVAQDAMMYGRLGIAAACVGGMKRCAQLMWRYSSRRTISTGLLSDNPVMIIGLNRLTAEITAVESLVRAIAQLLDHSKTVPIEAYTACKIAAPEFYWQAADDLVQCLGGRGYIETNIAPQILRDARILRIFEGPTETLKMFLGSKVINQSQDLKCFLDETLAKPDIYQKLKADQAKIQDYYISSYSPFTESVTATRWASILIGDLATWGILLAALKYYAPDAATAIAWIEQQYEQKLNQALSRTPEASINITEVINQYEINIGDIEQTLAGEDQELDALLRKSTQPVKESKTWQPSVTTETKYSLREIQNWLMNWLSQKLKISHQNLDPQQSFAEYGIDSVIAVELAQDLQEWLGYEQELEATIAWNYPTIAALSQYLAKSTDTLSQENTLLLEIQNKSEEEIQESIAQEIAELENWLETR